MNHRKRLILPDEMKSKNNGFPFWAKLVVAVILSLAALAWGLGFLFSIQLEHFAK